ncbi:MAG: potassium channel family protein [Pikeienuella sp.]
MRRLIANLVNRLAARRWSVLLTALVGTILLDAALVDTAGSEAGLIALQAGVFAGAIASAELGRIWQRTGLVMVAIWTVTRLERVGLGLAGLEGWLLLLSLAIAFGTLVVVFRVLIWAPTLDLERLVGAVFGYFLIALAWALLYIQLLVADPDAFQLAQGEPGAQLTYFSLVTLTTLGYGDITPVAPLARVLAGLQASVGTLYVAIFIGRIVGRLGPALDGEDRR